ncbi:MAG: hypothetical protein AB1649_28250, partial [Chloroflexota bacterium]
FSVDDANSIDSLAFRPGTDWHDDNKISSAEAIVTRRLDPMPESIHCSPRSAAAGRTQAINM